MKENCISIPIKEDKSVGFQTFSQSPCQGEANAEDASSQALHPHEPTCISDTYGTKDTLKEINPDIHQKTGLGASKLQKSIGIDTIGETSNRIDAKSRREYFLNTGIHLYRAATKGDWQAAESILRLHSDAIQLPVTGSGDTALHMAILARQTTFAKRLLTRMTLEDLEITNVYGCTALHAAAENDMVEVAKEMVEKNNNLLLKQSGFGEIPLQGAAFMGNRDVALYLFEKTPLENLEREQRIDLFLKTISNDLYDIALRMLKKDPKLAIEEDEIGPIALQLLAKKTSWIGTKIDLSAWEKFLCSWSNRICSKALMQKLAYQLVDLIWKKLIMLPEGEFLELLGKHSSILFDAAELGNANFLAILEHSYPDIANVVIPLDEEERSIFHIALLYRQESVFNLIYGDVWKKKVFLHWNIKDGNNLLHLVASMPLGNRVSTVSGAALQMHRELLWFKEIEKIVPPSHVKSKNSKGETPYDIFMKTHKKLRKDGEKWMKDTAKNCMLVATLITTVVFAAIFTVPGGQNEKDGIPLFMGNNWFSVFFISDALALLSSSSSIFIFLYIMTSRYKDEDFLKSLPTKLVFGLTTLFISIVGMILSFSAACILVYQSKTIRTPIVTTIMTGVPIILFICLHCKLWYDILCITCESKFLFRPSKGCFFSKMEDAKSSN